MTEPAARRPWSASPTVKLFTLGFLILLLLLPIGRLFMLVQERQRRSATVHREVAGQWGQAQTLAGAVLVLGNDPECPALTAACTQHLLPQEVHWIGEVRPETRRRGIFEVTVYEARLRVQGRFEAASVAPGSEAVLILGLGDVRGLSEAVDLTWNGEPVELHPGVGPAGYLEAGLHAKVPLPTLQQGADSSFEASLTLRGTESLEVLPLGKETTLELTSSWPSPSFGGAFLPHDREVTREGFSASWKVPYFGRDYPQTWRGHEHWRNNDVDWSSLRHVMGSSAFGVSLVRPADGYQQVERAVKYAALFILLTFLTYFVIEILGPIQVHPVQYGLVGLAVCLFFLLVLALAEHLGFALAYGIAVAATVPMITLYSKGVLGGRRHRVLATLMTGLYAYLFTLLQAEDYALLMGTVGLFLILAAVMYSTRHLDWYQLRSRPPGTSVSSP